MKLRDTFGRVFFNTSNAYKANEARRIFGPSNPRVGYLSHAVMEILETDLIRVARAKAAAAYREARIPVFVEHGGLFLHHLNGLPGALAKPTWALLKDRICDLVPAGASRRALAKSAVCFCDGRTRRVFEAETLGELANAACGASGLHWDPVFIPAGETRTYAELSAEEKLAHSASAKAYQALAEALGLVDD